MSSYGLNMLPSATVPKSPLSPTKLSRPASVPPPPSALTEDSIWNTALRPPPNPSEPRRPNRDEFELTRTWWVLSVSGGLW
jgi:hypothetical protein